MQKVGNIISLNLPDQALRNPYTNWTVVYHHNMRNYLYKGNDMIEISNFQNRKVMVVQNLRSYTLSLGGANRAPGTFPKRTTFVTVHGDRGWYMQATRLWITHRTRIKCQKTHLCTLQFTFCTSWKFSVSRIFYRLHLWNLLCPIDEHVN